MLTTIKSILMGLAYLMGIKYGKAQTTQEMLKNVGRAKKAAAHRNNQYTGWVREKYTRD